MANEQKGIATEVIEGMERVAKAVKIYMTEAEIAEAGGQQGIGAEWNGEMLHTRDLIDRHEAFRLLTEQMHSYTVSKYATAAECRAAQIAAAECAALIANMRAARKDEEI